MTTFSSPSVAIKKSPKDIFGFLTDFNNFEKLLPEQVTNWQTSGDKCSFTIQGMATIEMALGEKTEYSLVTYVSEGKSPLSFNLRFSINSINDQAAEVNVALSADLNAMLKMMASRPLQNFVNLLSDKLKEIFNEAG